MPVPPDPSSNPPPNRRKKSTNPPGKPSKRDAALKRTVVRPARLAVDPVDGAYISDRLTTLTHELANLLDGSMRCLSIARRNVAKEPVQPATAGEVARHLETVHAAMQQMAELVKCAMQGAPLSQSAGASEDTGSISEAARHAVEVMMPMAEERSIRLSGEIGDDLATLPGQSVFALLTNAIRNALESIERSGRTDGFVEVRVRMEAGRTGRCVVIEVVDNGEGPPEMPLRGGESVFRLGYTTKQGGSGVGLSYCRELVQELGGTISLTSRDLESTTGRGGAVLRAKFPAPGVRREEPDSARR